MPRRTLTITQLTASGKRGLKDERYNVDDVFGRDLLKVFVQWLKKHNPDSLKNEQNENYTRVISARRKGRSVFVVGAHGRFGSPVAAVDVNTHKVDHDLSPNHAPTIQTRFTFTVPPDGEYASFAIERQSNASSAIAIMNEFRHYLASKYSSIAFSLTTVQVSNAWLDNAELLSVTGVQYKRPIAPEDGLVAQAFDAQVETTVRAAKGRRHLQPGVLGALRSGALQRETILSLPADDYDEFKVQVEHDGQTKTYSLGNEKTPRFQYLLNDDGEKTLEDRDFILECRGQLQECYESMGLSWESSWLAKSITDAPLFVEAELLETISER